MMRAIVVWLCLTSAAAAQDFQVGSRAKAMGGSYTAFGDDPVAIWINPAGTASQPSQLAFTFQSFVQYEFDNFNDPLPTRGVGNAEQGLLDPPISPSFAGVVSQLGDADLQLAASIAYIRPFQIKYTYWYDPETLLTQTDQQFSRIRGALATTARLSDEGFFKRVSVGAGADFAYTKYKEIDNTPAVNRDTQVYEDSESAMGWGAGVLLNIYESDTFMLDAGVAYNSKVDFKFDLDKNIFPVWDWPTLYSTGAALYFGQGYPLRVTLDAQWVKWKEAVGDPDPTLGGFEDTLSYSLGAEYRFDLRPTLWLFTRAGLKIYDTPWKDESSLPALGLSELLIETKGDVVEILTLGFGFYWSRKTAANDTRVSGIDLAVELFGETEVLLGIAYTYQID
jgi:long-subunit fatty acid transport protein